MQTPIPTSRNEEISDAMCDYLGEIYRLGQGEVWVSTSALAERMDVSRPAAVGMIHRLHQQELVERLPYQGVCLTSAGRQIALLHLRRHRLIERFLVDVLKFGWDEVHDGADQLHKGVTQRVEDRIDELMGHPTCCPHGEPIPTRDGVMPTVEDEPLTLVPSGATGKISRVKAREPEKLRYLAEIGLVPGASFELLNRAPFNGPLLLQVGQNTYAIGLEVAAALRAFYPK